MKRANADFDRCVQLAWSVVLERRRKEKYRKQTPRAVRQYLAGSGYQKFWQLLVEAFKLANRRVVRSQPMAKTSPKAGYAVCNLAAKILQWKLREELRGVGRPPRGIMSSKARNLSTGRPRTMDPDDEQRWVHALCGAAIGLWARRELPRNPVPHSFDLVVRKFVGESDWQQQLRRLVVEAVVLPEMRDHNPAATDDALKQRARLALKTYPLPQELRLSQGKVGGNSR